MNLNIKYKIDNNYLKTIFINLLIVTFAAGVGEIIELDFRDFFTLEPSTDCKHDHLEIRDGPFGYSVPSHYYCGNQFPPKLVLSVYIKLNMMYQS